MNNIEITHNNKLLSLFHINACSLNKNFDIIAISETRITKQISLLNNLNLNNYSFEFTPTEPLQVVLFFTLLIIYHINVAMT